MPLPRVAILASALIGQVVSSTYPGNGTSATYDYVIVGGGTAGLVVAARLSEDPQISVAVVEAGTYYDISNPLLSNVPAFDSYWAGSNPDGMNLNVDWGFVTSPQAGAAGRRIHYARGKCLGGR